MRLVHLTESEVFDTKVAILMQRMATVPSLKLKLQWIILYGGREFSRRAQQVYQQLYDEVFRPRRLTREFPRMGQILRVDDVWRDLNESWFLRDLERIIPNTWRNGQDVVGARLLALARRERGPGDDSGFQTVLTTIVNRLLITPSRDEIGPLVAKHILSELFA